MNPLMVVMSVRDFKPCWFWISKVDFLDKLIIKNYPHDIAHKKARDFFLKHKEYSHLLVYAEDVIATPDMIELLIEDAKKHDFPVVSGYCNYVLDKKDFNFSDRDLRRIVVRSASVYKFYTVDDLLSGKLTFPFHRCFFVGLPLTLIRRDVLEKVKFDAYRYIEDYTLGYKTRRGIMFDLKFAIDCRNNNIPIVVDLRALTFHFGDTRKYINVKGKKRYVKFITWDGQEILLEEEKTEQEISGGDRRKWFREKFMGIKSK